MNNLKIGYITTDKTKPVAQTLVNVLGHYFSTSDYATKLINQLCTLERLKSTLTETETTFLHTGTNYYYKILHSKLDEKILNNNIINGYLISLSSIWFDHYSENDNIIFRFRIHSDFFRYDYIELQLEKRK